jgi:hypothetical protein
MTRVSSSPDGGPREGGAAFAAGGTGAAEILLTGRFALVPFFAIHLRIKEKLGVRNCSRSMMPQAFSGLSA